MHLYSRIKGVCQAIRSESTVYRSRTIGRVVAGLGRAVVTATVGGNLPSDSAFRIHSVSRILADFGGLAPRKAQSFGSPTKRPTMGIMW